VSIERRENVRVVTGGARRPVIERAWAAVEPIIEGSGLELVGVELGREGHRPVLWVFIDREGGVTIDDCARVHPEVSAALDVEDPIPESYELRVSSPGLDRPLFKASDFERFAGREAVVQLSEPLGGRRKFTGKILGLRGEAVALRCTDGEHEVPLDLIHRAHLKYDTGPTVRPKPRP
jgi:ribosome maturation factor RimP